MATELNTKALRFRPFGSRTQYYAWVRKNCSNCRKYNPIVSGPKGCSIDYSLNVALLGVGTVPENIAKRMGYLKLEGDAYSEIKLLSWDCPERAELELKLDTLNERTRQIKDYWNLPLSKQQELKSLAITVLRARSKRGSHILERSSRLVLWA